MTIRRIRSGPGLPAGFPFSLASEANGTLYISGMPALDPARAPARFTFQAGAMPFGAKVELQAVAAR
ncbi:MAG TPA: hypothetical protein VGJ50_07690 [Streptosporangiaceae bacterium]